MANCINCNRNSVNYVSAKCSDRFQIVFADETEHEGYVPDDLGIGGDKYIEFDYCGNCGFIQDNWPKRWLKKDSEEDD